MKSITVHRLDDELAAQCVETGSVLVTDDAHFRRVPGLRPWNQ